MSRLGVTLDHDDGEGHSDEDEEDGSSELDFSGDEVRDMP
jgi:hypothetical protein